jgi:hypothetical protein
MESAVITDTATGASDSDSSTLRAVTTISGIPPSSSAAAAGASCATATVGKAKANGAIAHAVNKKDLEKLFTMNLPEIRDCRNCMLPFCAKFVQTNFC